MRVASYLDGLAEAALRETASLDEPAPAMVRATQDAKFGDYQVNGVMPLGKRLGRPPRDIANLAVEALRNHASIAAAEVAGPGFINLTLDDAWLSERLTESLGDLDRDGVPAVEKSQKIVVDYSSPNIAKQMHVGHLRSTVIGDAIARLLAFVGHEVVRDNHIGDWGTQFGLLMVGMREWGDEAALEHDPVRELERVYKLSSEKATADEAFAESARAELAKLQAGDPENRALWEHFVEVSRKSLDAVYNELGVTFDEWLGESAYQDALPGVVDTLVNRNVAREDDGAICVFFNELEHVSPELRKHKTPFIVQKKDGAFLYSTTDIATVFYRRDRFSADRAVYVVDNRQSLHFRQLFALIELLGIQIELEHVGFGTVLGPDGKPLRTRDAGGQVITLLSLLEEAKSRAKQRIEEAIAEGRLRVPQEDVPLVARVVGIGAVKYADLRQNRLSDYHFDWDKMISFSGNAGPYLQYAYARCRSIFAKGGIDADEIASSVDIELAAPEELVLGRRLIRFADAVYAATETYQPHLLCDHLYELARAFSSFYTECPVLDAADPVRASRLGLTALVARQLQRGLSLIGIGVVERM